MFDLDFDEYFYDYVDNTKSEDDLVLKDIEYWEQVQKQFEDYYYIESLKRSGQND